MTARRTSVRIAVLTYIAANPGCSTADVDRACRTARGGHKWMYATIARARRDALVTVCAARTESARGGARGLCLAPAGEALLHD